MTQLKEQVTLAFHRLAQHDVRRLEQGGIKHFRKHGQYYYTWYCYTCQMKLIEEKL